MKANLKLTPILILIISLSSACNAPFIALQSPSGTTEEITTEPSPLPATLTPDVDVEPVPLDPCTLVDAEEVAEILGGGVEVMPATGTGGCSYMKQGDSPSEMTQLIVSAAQGEEAKSLTLLSLGMLAGFSGDPSIQEKFEAVNEQAGSLNLTEMIHQLGNLLKDAGLDVEYQEDENAATLSVVYESEAYNQATLIHTKNDTYVSINQVGTAPLLERSKLTEMANGAFDQLPPVFYVLDSDQDGSFQIELGDDTETETSETTTDSSTAQPLWVTSANAGQVTAIDPKDNSILATIDVGPQPSDVVVFDGYAFVISYSEETLRKVDPDLLEVVQTVKFDGHTMHLAAGDGAIWVVGGGGVRMLDLETGTRYGVVYADCQDVVLGGGSVWVSQLGDQQILRIDPESRKVISTVKLDGQPAELAFGLDQLWVILHDKREVISIDPETEEIGFRLSDENTILGIVTDLDRLWYITPRGGMYFKPATLGKGRLINQHRPSDILYYAGSLWVSSPDEGFVTRLDIDGRTVLADIEIGGDPHALGAPEEVQ